MTALNTLLLGLLMCPGGLALTRTGVRKFADGTDGLPTPFSGPTAEGWDGKADGCEALVDGCQSVLEVKQEDQCVMADALPQHEMGSNIDESITKFQSMLEKYYGNASVLENMLSMSTEGHSILVDKMARALTGKKKFVVGAIGSSVTAGHDNCHIDAYPSQLMALVTPLFKQAGVEFEARNGGIGGACGDSTVDQVNCLEHIVGDDVDVTHWSWDYFLPDDPESQERFIRISLSMPNQPMPMLLTLGRTHYPSHEKFSELYSTLGYHSVAASLGTPKEVPDMEAPQGRKWGFVGDGHQHTVSRLADKFPEGHCRRKSTSELWRNWHGGPMLYQLISDALGWTYVSALKEALVQQRILIVDPKPQERKRLPEGISSSLETSPRCISFNKPGAGTAVTLVEDQSGKVNVSEENHRADMLPDAEKHEPRCEHLDVCGTATSDNGRLTFDLQAKHKTPLTEGILVVCIGGGSPDEEKKQQLLAPESDVEQLFDRRQRLVSIAELPPVAAFPHCRAGSVESVEVDGQKYDVQSAKMWTTMKKCGEFKMDNKDARYVTVQSPCGVTHLFAM